jgi:hypothetical protein
MVRNESSKEINEKGSISPFFYAGRYNGDTQGQRSKEFGIGQFNTHPVREWKFQ